MLTITRTTVQIVREVLPSGSPNGIRMLNATAVPPMMPPSWSSFDSARMIQRKLTQPIRPTRGGTLL